MFQVILAFVLCISSLYSSAFLEEIDPNSLSKKQDFEDKADYASYKVEISNKGLFLKFNNGNIATLLVSKSKQAMDFKVSLRQIEATCSETVLTQTCDFRNYFVMYKFALGWTKHSNPKKLNTKVELKSSITDATSFEKMHNFIWENQYQSFPQLYPRLYENESKELFKNKYASLSCPNLDWISHHVTNKEKKLLVSEWTSEVMGMNPETDLSENRTARIFQNISGFLKNNKLVFTDIGFNPYGNNGVGLISGDIVGFNYFSEKGKHCETSFNVNIEEFAEKAQKLSVIPNDLSNFSALKWNSIEEVENFFRVVNEESNVDAPPANSRPLQILKGLNLLFVIPTEMRGADGKISSIVNKFFHSEIK